MGAGASDVLSQKPMILRLRPLGVLWRVEGEPSADLPPVIAALIAAQECVHDGGRVRQKLFSGDNDEPGGDDEPDVSKRAGPWRSPQQLG